MPLSRFSHPLIGPTAAVTVALLLAACHKDREPVAQAAPSPEDAALQAALDRYQTLGRQGTPAEKCEQAKRVVAAEQAAGHAAAVPEWQAKQAVDCSAVVSPALADT